MKTIVHNLATEYQDEGSGPIMLLLHGWKSNLHTFDAITPSFSKDFRVIRLDLPGFGGSEMSSSPWGVEEYANFVKAFIEKLGISVAVLIGHSFGGRIAIKGVSEGIILTKKLILINSAGLAKQHTLRSLLFTTVAKIGKVVLFSSPIGKERLRRWLYEQAGSDYLDSGSLKETFLLVTREDLSQNAIKVSVPTLLIWGEDDTTTPLSDGKRLHSLIPGSQLKILEKAGHFVHQERAEDVSALITTFVSQ